MNTNDLPDDFLINEIRIGGVMRNRAWEYIYKAWRPYYIAAIRNLGASIEELEEIISGVIVNVDRQINKPDFSLKSVSLKKYFTICLINALKSRPRNPLFLDTLSVERSGEDSQVIKDELVEQLNFMLDSLGNDCKKVLTMWSEGFKMKEIAENMGYFWTQSAKNKKKKCLDKLIELAPII